MFKHLILLNNSYTLDKTLAWHYSGELGFDTLEIKNKFNDILKDNKVYQFFNSHTFPTDNPSWDSVLRYDCYFEDMEVYEGFDDLDRLMSALKSDSVLTSIDLANAIITLNTQKCQLDCFKIEQLIYIISLEYKAKTGLDVVTDKIELTSHGAYIDKVRALYENDKVLNDKTGDIKNKIYALPRIWQAHNGKLIADICKEIVKAYIDKPVEHLVNNIIPSKLA